MSRAAIIRHELLHVCAGAVALADLHPEHYGSAEVWIDAKDDTGEAAVSIPSLDFPLQEQIGAVVALGPLVDAKTPTALVDAADDRLAAAGLSAVDIRGLRRWKGTTRELERYTGATQRLARSLPLDRLGALLCDGRHTGDPLPLGVLVPQPKAAAALDATDVSFRARKRDPRKAPTYAL